VCDRERGSVCVCGKATYRERERIISLYLHTVYLLMVWMVRKEGNQKNQREQAGWLAMISGGMGEFNACMGAS